MAKESDKHDNVVINKKSKTDKAVKKPEKRSSAPGKAADVTSK